MVIYKKSQVIYQYEEKRVTIWLIFMVIFSNKIMQNYQNNYPPQKGNGNYPWCRGNGERVIPIYGLEVPTSCWGESLWYPGTGRLLLLATSIMHGRFYLLLLRTTQWAKRLVFPIYLSILNNLLMLPFTLLLVPLLCKKKFCCEWGWLPQQIKTIWFGTGEVVGYSMWLAAVMYGSCYGNNYY